MHACTHACTHSLTHTHTHAYTHILTHARTHMHTLTYAPMHTHTTSSQIKSEGGGSSSYRWCKGRGLEQQRFYEMAKLRQQFQEILQVLTAMCLHHELQTNLQPRLSVLNFILQLWVLQGCKTKDSLGLRVVTNHLSLVPRPRVLGMRLEPLYSCLYYIPHPQPHLFLLAYGLGMRMVIWELLQILVYLVVSCVLGVKPKVLCPRG